MKDIKYVMFKVGKDIGVVEAMLLEDNSWILIDTYLDFKKFVGFNGGYNGIGRENIIASFSDFKHIIGFLKGLTKGEITWV